MSSAMVFFQPLDALHEGLQVILGKAGGRPLFVGGGGMAIETSSGDSTSAAREWFRKRAPQVKARDPSSPEYTGPQT